MCDTYCDDVTVSHDANVILRRLACDATRRQLGHCVVKGPDGRWNVPGLISVDEYRRLRGEL